MALVKLDIRPLLSPGAEIPETLVSPNACSTTPSNGSLKLGIPRSTSALSSKFFVNFTHVCASLSDTFSSHGTRLPHTLLIPRGSYAPSRKLCIPLLIERFFGKEHSKQVFSLVAGESQYLGISFFNY